MQRPVSDFEHLPEKAPRHCGGRPGRSQRTPTRIVPPVSRRSGIASAAWRRSRCAASQTYEFHDPDGRRQDGPALPQPLQPQNRRTAA